jgi:hypothetical protein
VLQDNIDSEEAARIAADDAEAATRFAADVVLQDNIDSEEAARIAADDAEAATRFAADAFLQGQIDTNVASIAQNASDIDRNKKNIDQNTRGIAMVAALQHTTVLPGMTNALDVSAAHFEGETGMALNFARRINENWQINFGAASTTDFDESVIKAGVGVQW